MHPIDFPSNIPCPFPTSTTNQHYCSCDRYISKIMSRLFIRNPLQWYAQKLDSHPIATKVITSGLISGSGDLLCQYLSTKKDNEIEDEKQQHSNSYDWKRTINFTILGGVLVAPTVHIWYGYFNVKYTWIKYYCNRQTIIHGSRIICTAISSYIC